MKSFLDPFREFLIASGEKATPFLFPFFLNGKFCAAVVFAGIVLFFVDAPFYDKDKLFVMIRCGRAKWVTGHFFYIIFVSIGYMLCWVGIIVLMLIPRIYTNKPRTTGEGYKGMLHQPIPDEAPDLYGGIIAIRKMHLRVIQDYGFTCANEMLYPENRSYLDDILSYEAIGARSVENQQHLSLIHI